MELAGLASRSGPNAAGYAAGIGPLLWSLSVAAAAISLARHLKGRGSAAGCGCGLDRLG